jgi:hypothetical protein
MAFVADADVEKIGLRLADIGVQVETGCAYSVALSDPCSDRKTASQRRCASVATISPTMLSNTPGASTPDDGAPAQRMKVGRQSGRRSSQSSAPPISVRVPA